MIATQRVRPFAASDISDVAELHRSVFRKDEGRSPELDQSYRCFFHDVYLNNPWRDDEVSPLVCEDGSGKIIGFLGVMPRPLRWNGRTVRAAVSSMFMVDANHRFGLAAVQLLRTFLSGPQELSFADESTGQSRKLWERLGGVTSMLHSMYWIRPLRPAQFLSFQLRYAKGIGGLARAAAPLCRIADAAIKGTRLRPFYCSPPRLPGEGADTHTLLECCRAIRGPETLRPEYDEQSLSWLLDMASHGGNLKKVVVRSASGTAAGWYVYQVNQDRIAEVLQIGAKQHHSKDVLDHLMNHAEGQGAVAVTGRMDPRFLEDLGAASVMRPRYWMLVHSRNPELLSVMERGEPYLTRLEGEWCMQFHASRYRSGDRGSYSQALTEQPITVKAETGGVEVVDLLGDEWRRLYDEGGCHEPFCRPEWVAAYIRAFAPEDKVVLITARVRGALQAVLPLIESRAFSCGVHVTRLEGAANAHSCRFDMVRSPGAEGDAAVLAVWRFLKELPGWDVIELPYVPEGGALERLASAARLDGFPVGRSESMRSPYLPLSWLSPDQDPLMLETTAAFRANVRRKLRQIKSRGNLALRRVNTADPALLQSFYDLESSSWKGRQGTAIACARNTRQFYDEVARNGERFGYLSLSFLDFNGHTIAAQFGIEEGGRYFMPKLAFDESYKHYGPGHLLIHAIMRDCVEHGLTEYDFTGPWAEYKAKWTSSARVHSTVSIFRNGMLGRFLYTAKFTLQAGVKNMLRPILTKAGGSPGYLREKVRRYRC